jgi:hypothetical protein
MHREKHGYNYPVVGLLTNAEIDSCAQTEGKFQVVLHVIYDLDLAI